MVSSQSNGNSEFDLKQIMHLQERSLNLGSLSTIDELSRYQASTNYPASQNKYIENNACTNTRKKNERNSQSSIISRNLNKESTHDDKCPRRSLLNAFSNRSKPENIKRNSLPTFSTNRLGALNNKSFRNCSCNSFFDNKRKIQKEKSKTLQQNRYIDQCDLNTDGYNQYGYTSYVELFQDDKNFSIDKDGWVTLASEVEESSNLQKILSRSRIIASNLFRSGQH